MIELVTLSLLDPKINEFVRWAGQRKLVLITKESKQGLDVGSKLVKADQPWFIQALDSGFVQLL